MSRSYVVVAGNDKPYMYHGVYNALLCMCIVFFSAGQHRTSSRFPDCLFVSSSLTLLRVSPGEYHRSCDYSLRDSCLLCDHLLGIQT